ncbi:MAG: hypothetical protein Q9M75_04075, partial [Ghiorsea sp.]|nr:hypothetical protein [Ghiorsea sp.]
MYATNNSVILGSEKNYRLKRLFYARLTATAIALLLFSWFLDSTHIIPAISLPHTVLIWLVLLTIQWSLFRFPKFMAWNILCQLTSDLT